VCVLSVCVFFHIMKGLNLLFFHRKMGAVVSLSGVTILLEPIAWLVGKKIAGLILRFPIFLVPVALVLA
jgi:hypothetical protein